jgi:2-dehydropantoate 2-reductase
MRFLIAGAGAIGAYIGARMANAGLDVTLFARGPHLRAMQEQGVQVRSPEGDFVARPKIAGSLEEVDPVDVVFLAVKAHGLPQLVPQLKSVLGPDTTVVSTQNGIPWWYFQGFGGEWEGLRLERVDPGGIISSAIEARRVVGSIVYFSTEISSPGVVQHIEGNRISLGEPDGSRSDRTRKIAEALVAAGLRCPITARIRHEIWVKVLGNASLNPVSALTRSTLVQMMHDPGVSTVIRNIMQEVEAVSHKLRMELPVSIDQRMVGAEKVGEHKTSMLQDLEAGRPMELEALVGAVVELGERVGLPMPYTRTVYSCAKLLGQSATPQPAK